MGAKEAQPAPANKPTSVPQAPPTTDLAPLGRADIRFLSRLVEAVEQLEKNLNPPQVAFFDACLPEPLTINYIRQRLQEIRDKLPSVDVTGPV
jgi:hypothetical protein